MPTFAYRAKSSPGQVVEGSVEAETPQAAAEKLGRMGYFPIALSEARGGAAAVGGASGLSRYPFQRVRQRDLAVFTRQLADLLGSGLTLFRALGVLEVQTESARLRTVITSLRDQVKDGRPFSEALGGHPRVFSRLYASLVRAGEVAGALEGVLGRLADFTEQDEEFRAKVQNALVYPATIAGFAGVTVVFLLTYVIPTLTGVFEEMGQSLPVPTQILVTVSHVVRRFWWLMLAVVAGIGYAIARGRRTEEGGRGFDRFVLGLPVLGSLLLRAEIARFSRTLGTLVGNGVAILQALDVVAHTMTSVVLRGEVEGLLARVREGESLAAAMRAARYFPAFVVNMVAVGEEGGLLEQGLMKVASAYERETDRTVKTVTAILEPALILIVGVIVAFVVIAMLLPMFEIGGILQ